VTHTLLLADDSVTIQRVIELTFADEDISVVAFSDGEHAIASLSHTPPDIVLADIGMPGRSGYEVARHIKQTPALWHIPVLLLTGAFEPVDQAKLAEVGCDGVLTKPFEPQFVISRVKELLAKSDGEGSGESRPVRAVDKESEVESYFEQLDQAFATLSSAPASGPVAVPDPLPDVPDTPPPAPAAVIPMPIPSNGGHAAAALADGPGMADAFAALLTAERSGESSAAALAIFAPPAEPEVSKDELVEEITRRVTDDISGPVTDQVTGAVMAKLSGGLIRDAAQDVIGPTAERVVRDAIAAIVTPIAERVVHATIVDIVSVTAERLVREEIERVKASIK